MIDDFIELTARFREIDYHIATIRYPGEELFYHFKYSTNNRKHWNWNDKKLTGCIDHISFHKDGEVHRTLHGGVHEGIQTFQDGTFLPIKTSYTPLFIETIAWNKYQLQFPLKKINRTSEKEICLVDFPNPTSFSVLLFLVPNKYKNEDHLSNLWINFFSPGSNFEQRIYLKDFLSSSWFFEVIPAWNNYNLLCMGSPITLDMPKKVQGNLIERGFAYCDLHYFLSQASKSLLNGKLLAPKKKSLSQS